MADRPDPRETRTSGTPGTPPTPGTPRTRADNNPAGPVRAEDAFDAAAVAQWLRAHADDPTGMEGTPELGQFAGGASNLTFLLRWPTRDLILRRPPRGSKAKSAHDMRREYTLQSRLAPVFPYVAPMVAFCDDQSVIGSDFYVMERLAGTILRADLPEGMTLSEDEARMLCTNFLDVLVELHAVDPHAAGLDDLGKGQGYVGRQVGGWSDRYRKARTDNVGDLEHVMSWLDTHQPADVATCVIHNDFRLDNAVLDPHDPLTVRGVLDWEMATLGDPFMDLGGAMAYWIQADDDEHFQLFRRQPSHLPGMLTRWQMVEYYAQRTGRSITPRQWLFYEVFGLFRLAVIAQQIYYRYHHGQTTNEAYAGFLPVVHYLDRRCTSLIARAEAT
jgi:aminoglycoside phosphotransferase (APT) family kinase protein